MHYCCSSLFTFTIFERLIVIGFQLSIPMLFTFKMRKEGRKERTTSDQSFCCSSIPTLCLLAWPQQQSNQTYVAVDMIDFPPKVIYLCLLTPYGFVSFAISRVGNLSTSIHRHLR
ncbi:hypothetical protein HZ326_28256 [Fusarium oxysporum f. sp. albedinis]|nr:hypothetical protein HZ326_28256 [Fusarium oxysporum f. sp. albedinis]